MSVQRVLVTGAAGLIGRATLDLLDVRGVTANALVLEDPGDLPAELVIEGDAADPAVVRAALAGADAVIHLAAIATPERDPAEKVFACNTQSTFTVLEQAGRAGVTRACVASSQAASGLVFAARDLHPAYVPVDHDLPSQIEDPYALSKQVDELTAAMMARRHGMSVVALRLPYVGGFGERLPDFARRSAADPGCARAGPVVHTWRLVTRPARACWPWRCRGPELHPVLVAAPLRRWSRNRPRS